MKQKKLSWLIIFAFAFFSVFFASPVETRATNGASAVNRTPFQFPLTNMYQEITSDSDFFTYIIDSTKGSITVDGVIPEISNKTTFLAEYVVPASGHPAGIIYSWVMNDQDNLYIIFDVTPDNTMDGNEDYVKAYIKTSYGVKVYKVSLLDTAWGMPGFISTERANYEHKIYEFKIPFSEIGIANGQTSLDIAFSAYGTMAAPPSVSFKEAVGYYSGGQPYGLATGKFNNDNYPDIVAVNANTSNLTVLPNNGNGTFAEGVVSPAGYAPTSVIACNLNGDTFDDLVVSGSAGTYAFVSTGDCHFTPLIPCGSGYSSTVGDFDNDGDTDVATTDWNQNKMFIYLNDGTGKFNKAQEISTSDYPGEIIAADINNDGNQDLAIVFGDRFVVSTLQIRFGDGSGTFSLAPSKTIDDIGEIIEGGMRYSAGGVTASDFNSDGNIDIAFLYFDDTLSFTEFAEFTSILLGDGTGNFSTTANWDLFPVNLGPVDSVAGDFNDDGYIDLATTNCYSKNVSILANGGNFTLFPKQDISLSQKPSNITADDFNQDGLMDIALTNFDNGNVLVLINNTGGLEGYTYTVTFNKNGGDTEANPNTIDVKSPDTTVQSLPKEPTKAYESFEGWWTGNGIANDGIGIDGGDGWGIEFNAETNVDADITVFAKWANDLSDETTPDLKGLSVSGITISPVFASGTTEYSANVVNSKNTVTITATPVNGAASVKINGTNGTSGTIPLVVGSNTITIQVTSEDGLHTKNYIITITRAASVGGGSGDDSGGGSSGGTVVLPQPISLQRFGGADRFATSLAIAESLYSGSINTCILTTGLNFPDGLSGSLLSKKFNAPILLSGNDPQESQDVLNYIKSHLAKDGTLYILGGQGAVPEKIIDALKAMGIQNIRRLSGIDRYSTNLAILKMMNSTKGTPVIVATGVDFPDSLSISSVTASLGYPLLLCDSETMSQEASDYLSNLAPEKLYIIGGTGAISDRVLQQLQRLTQLPDASIVRIQGLNRYLTALNIARTFSFATDKVILATGSDYPDAILGSTLAAYYNSPILLTGGEMSSLKEFLKSKEYKGAIICGGSGVVSEDNINYLFK